MKAAVWHGKGKISVEHRVPPEPSAGEVLLRTRTAGICGTDLSIYQGKFDPQRCVPPLVLGHEMCGVIERLGPGVEGWIVGERVVVDPLIPCGRCYACQSGFPHVCTSLQLLGIDRDGAFAEYATAQAGRLHRLPERVTDIEGALVEPVAVAVHDVRRAQLAIGDTALVVGGGPIGLLIAMVARCAGSGLVAVSEINEQRRELADRLGFRTYSPAGERFRERFRERLREEFAGTGPDIVFDATGSAAGYQSAVDCVRVRGRVVQVGIPKGPVEVDLRRLNFAELNIVGTRVYAPVDIEAAIGLLAGKRIATEGLVSTHPLADCGALMDELTGGASKLLKPVIVFNP
jgi:2-desacetyl-2-hydroxyethyl bacteriochlorophyllide A dehydrogenase